MKSTLLPALIFGLLIIFVFSAQNIYKSASDKEKIAFQILQKHISKHKNKKEKSCVHDFWNDIQLDKIEIVYPKITFFLELNKHLLDNYDDHLFEEIGLSLFNLLPQNKKLQSFHLLVKDEQGKYVEYSSLSQEPPRTFPEFQKNTDPGLPIALSADPNYNAFKQNNPNVAQTQPTGSLSGKTVWLSPGHGWLYFTSLGTYSTQRGNTNDMVEDFASIESVNYYLLKYLYNAGANVWMVRERDVNTNEVIVDNSQAGYSETGTWFTTSSTGYNPATGLTTGASGYRYTWSDPAATTATASWTPNIPEAGWYWVSTLYRSGANRVADTRYEVTHAGGTSPVSINQEVHGLTWVYLGQFYFDAGTTGKVTLLNETSDPTASQVVIADAMRFGGGINGASGSARNIADCSNGSVGPTQKARFEESARQYAPYQNYPTCRGDVTMRPHYAEYELAKGTAQEKANSIYVSWHSNASSGAARGTVTYAYNGANGNFPVTPNSYALQAAVHSELVNGIKTGWDPNWNDRGLLTANFGEVRELSTMPGCLLETVFHDNATDAQQYTTPAFRNIMARGVYKGIVKFFHIRDNSPNTTVPEPPTHLAAKNSGSGQITITWNTPPSNSGNGLLGDAATGYKLYIGTHGKAFADGIAVSGNSYTMTGLSPNATYYFRVAGTNLGGESFPTATVAARTPVAGTTAIDYLIVDGFDRLDRSAALRITSSSVLVNLRRLFLEKMNSYDYMVEHAKSLEYCGVSFDGASNEAVIAGTVSLPDYTGVNWFLGEESTLLRTFDNTEKSLVISYLNGGGNLIVSGAEIGWDVGRSGSANTDLNFYNNYLKATYNGDDGSTYNFSGQTGGIFAGITGGFDDNTVGYYDADYPDRLGATGGSSVVLNYSGGTGDGAAVAYKGNDFGVVNFGFPLETVTNEQVRNTLICNAVNFLAPEEVNLPLKVLLSGPFDPANSLMDDQLRVASFLPTTQPYSSAPWNYSGTEITDTGIFATTGNTAIVDWVLVEVRDASAPATIILTTAGLLRRDGRVVDMDGVSDLVFSSLSAGNYHIAIKHRNHLPIMTANPVSLTKTSVLVDFTTLPTYGSNAVQIIGGIQTLWSGDGNSDEAIDAADRSLIWNDRNQTLYSNSDVSMDGFIDASDRSLVWNNRNKTAQLP